MIKKPKGQRPMPVKLKAEAKTRIILEEIAKGCCYSDLIERFSNEWGCSPKTMGCYIKEAMDYLHSDEAAENLRDLNIQRLDELYKESVSDGDRKNALKAIDLQNKTLGIYEEKVEVKTDEPIEFTFNF